MVGDHRTKAQRPETHSRISHCVGHVVRPRTRLMSSRSGAVPHQCMRHTKTTPLYSGGELHSIWYPPRMYEAIAWASTTAQSLYYQFSSRNIANRIVGSAGASGFRNNAYVHEGRMIPASGCAGQYARWTSFYGSTGEMFSKLGSLPFGFAWTSMRQDPLEHLSPLRAFSSWRRVSKQASWSIVRICPTNTHTLESRPQSRVILGVQSTTIPGHIVICCADSTNGMDADHTALTHVAVHRLEHRAPAIPQCWQWDGKPNLRLWASTSRRIWASKEMESVLSCSKSSGRLSY